MIVRITIPDYLFQMARQFGRLQPLAATPSIDSDASGRDLGFITEKGLSRGPIHSGSSKEIACAPAPRLIARARCWLQNNYLLNSPKRLRVVETVSLGEKRFVALIRVEEREFLVGGGASGVSLLAECKSVPSTPGFNVDRSSL